ncbi:conserved hypothetical protein [Psychromonas ingrahamii 37]|uniref:Uncharacterized protein n=1 Tax=Psychromonas ingrahamii (strain DSM 17664 / CCUG 51855 / 37) TaxID=357804 RepID=A1SVC8_PSYIN|nr:DUF6629 family protein [Psychromonas ingrahamii]ABM03443.1 conserved hypothetical protein [Psychromonas ingrahamii 37]
MCFSATASISLGLVLVPVGIYSIKRAATLPSGFRVLALTPLLFGLQQTLEGFVWLGLASGDALATRFAALGFNFFSLFFWLVWIPLCCYSIEPSALKRKLFSLLSILGLAHGLSMYVPLLLYKDWLTVDIVGHSIHYSARLLHDGYVPIIFLQILYPLIIIVPLLLNSNAHVKILGLITLSSLLLTRLYFNDALISVWCYFAAVSSIYILFMIIQTSKRAEKSAIGITI